MQAIALIADIVGSRQLKSRDEVQRNLDTVCSALNAEREQLGLLSPVTVTLGDEFQALFSRAGEIWRMVTRIELALYPVQIRFAFGVGDISTDINPDTALGMDGPAFYHARDGVEFLRKERLAYRVVGLGDDEALVNYSLALFYHQRAKFRANRLHILAGLLESRSIDAMVAALDISEQAVYRNIRDGALESACGLLREVSRLMDSTLARQT